MKVQGLGLRQEARGARFARIFNSKLLIMNGKSLGAPIFNRHKSKTLDLGLKSFKKRLASMLDKTLLPSFKYSMLAKIMPHRHEALPGGLC